MANMNINDNFSEEQIIFDGDKWTTKKIKKKLLALTDLEEKCLKEILNKYIKEKYPEELL